jgi:hypothetical protein
MSKEYAHILGETGIGIGIGIAYSLIPDTWYTK